MTEVDIVKWESMLFQLEVLKIARKLQDVCNKEKECTKYMSELDKMLIQMIEGMDDFYLYQLRVGAMNSLMVEGVLEKHLEGVPLPEVIEGEDLWRLALEFNDTYKELYKEIIFIRGVEGGFVQLFCEKFNDDEELEYFKDREIPGHELWVCLRDLGADLELDESYNLETLSLSGGSVYNLEIKNELLCKALSMTKDREQERLFIMHYIEKLMYQIYGMAIVAIVEAENSIKIIGFTSDYPYDDEYFVESKLYNLPKLILMKRYMEERILK